ncbi:mitogen-activated protein kinase kinase kinase 18 isoform X2 [Brassica rapa]|uniref:mitogen-activated protein kinase kinase kinase 18 isoform X2 n=1 Tax=Brassica campestris TaxID=3711 RepID=UPI00142D685D|nr:mitogen-activated protein kinase kinase kinase 18 isoform X2 [Brassica rapa]
MEKQSITNTNTNTSSSSSWIRRSYIGRGCFGTVSKAVSKIDGRVFAVKSVNLAACLPSQSESLENEIAILRSLKPHPHIVTFLGDDVSKEGTTSFRNLHLEYLPEGDVANGGTIVNETLLRRYVWCLVSALRHVHSNGIVHCDVKSKNVLVADGGSSVKLADFGSAMALENPTDEIAPRGSPLWMAPEVVRREYQGPESDVWSLGCTVIEMLTGKPAWEDNGFESLSRIGFSNELPFIPVGISELGGDFLEKCLRRDRKSVVSRDTVSAVARISKLTTRGGAIWESDGWIEVRSDNYEKLAAKGEYPVLTRAELQLNVSSVSTDDSVLPSGSEESASVMTCELMLVLLLVVEDIQIYATFYINIIVRMLYCCCCYYHQSNKNKKLRKNLSFVLSLNFFVRYCM